MKATNIICSKILPAIFIASLSLIACIGLHAGNLNSSGKYNITVVLSDLPAAGSAVSVKNTGAHQKLYLYKCVWGGADILLDSAEAKGSSYRFRGRVYPLNINKIDSLFTAGQYKIKAAGQHTLFSFMYSDPVGKNFTETFIELKKPAESSGQLLRNFTVTKPSRNQQSTENEIFLEFQNYLNNIAGGGLVSSAQFIPELKTRIENEAPNSLTELLLLYGTGRFEPELDPSGPLPFTDSRLCYTDFGKPMLTTYLKQLQYNTPQAIGEALGKLLDNSRLVSPVLKSTLAMEIFNFFKDSYIMGNEAVAIQIAENYILNKKADVDRQTFFEVNYFCTLNKNSLLGMKAPALALNDVEGKIADLKECMGEYTIIYFYTDDCNFCAEESEKLVQFFDNYIYTPLNLYAVYIGRDSTKWKEYAKTHFATVNPFVSRTDVADIERESNFAIDYGVVSTPAIFLLNPAQRIIGRKIKSENVRQILENEQSKRESMDSYFARIFPGNLPTHTVENLIDTLAHRAEGEFRTEMLRELFIFLGASEDYANQEGAVYLGEKYIAAQPHQWEDTVFTANVVNSIKSFRLNPLGSKATQVKLYDISGFATDLLSHARQHKVLFFYNPTCALCTEYLEVMKQIHQSGRGKVEITGIYTGGDYETWRNYVIQNGLEWRNLWDKDRLGALAEKYDIAHPPAIYLLDSNNTVIAKDITPQDLLELVNNN